MQIRNLAIKTLVDSSNYRGEVDRMGLDWACDQKLGQFSLRLCTDSAPLRRERQ